MLILIFLSYSFGDLRNDISDFWESLNDIGGPTGFEVMQLDVHARANGMAGNNWDGGTHSLFSNPSEIIYYSNETDNTYNLTFAYKKLFLDMNTNCIGFTGKEGNNAFGFSFLGFYSGEMDLQDESPGTPLGIYSGENLIFGITYARSFGSFNIGGTIRTLQERIFEVSYSTYSFDLGMSRSFKAFNDRDFRFDMSFLHIGPKYGPEGADDDFRLPTTWHIGLKGNYNPYFIGFSMNKPLNTKIQYLIGIEYRLNEYLSFRAGRKTNNPLEMYSFGLGLHKNDIFFDYSFAPTVINVEGSHLLTISIGL